MVTQIGDRLWLASGLGRIALGLTRADAKRRLERLVAQAFAPVMLVVLMLAGCVSREEALEPRWAPLVKIVELPEWPLERGRVSTIYSVMVTPELAAVDSWFPAGSVEREALLRHEQAHALRQFTDPLWFAKYAASAEFRWDEERVGYRLELLWLRDHGVGIVPWDWAYALATGYDGMVPFDVALAWVVVIINEPR